MKKFFLGFSLSLILLSTVWVVGIYSQFHVGTPSSRWVFDAYQKKISTANNMQGNRLLIVAGSNALFGINTQKLENYWNRPAINLGVNAGLGLPYILHLAKNTAQSGDVILLPLEYALYLDDGKPNSQIVDYIIARDPSYLKEFSPVNFTQFIISMSPDRWVLGLSKPIDMPVTSGTYGAHHIDQHGDQILTSKNDRSEGDILAVSQAKVWQYGLRDLSEKGGWHQLKLFAQWAKDNNICIVAVPTVLLHHTQYDTDIVEKNFYDGLPRRITQLGIPYIGKPRDFMYPNEWFFDTDHHLQDWARDKHTDKLIRILDKNPLTYCPQL